MYRHFVAVAKPSSTPQVAGTPPGRLCPSFELLAKEQRPIVQFLLKFNSKLLFGINEIFTCLHFAFVVLSPLQGIISYKKLTLRSMVGICEFGNTNYMYLKSIRYQR